MSRKNKPPDTSNPTGCWAFFVSVGRAVNQRWARARNAMRQRFRRQNTSVGPLRPEELENESGTPDLVFKLKPLGQTKAETLGTDTVNTKEDRPLPATVVTEKQLTDNNDLRNNQSKESMTSSVLSAITTLAVTESLSKFDGTDDHVVCEKNVSPSLASSEISQIADMAVNESLCSIVATDNTNSSAKRPRSVNEMFATFGIQPCSAGEDGMPPVDV